MNSRMDDTFIGSEGLCWVVFDLEDRVAKLESIELYWNHTIASLDIEYIQGL